MRTQLAALALLLAFPAWGQTVTDGDTIKLDGITYRIWGIDAPELHQSCGGGWAAGHVAAAYMRGLVQGRKIACAERARDRYGRTVALCKADGRDIGAEMVKAGMAYAFVRYSLDYVGIEREARAAGLGVHAHGCTVPWEWRARDRTGLSAAKR